MRNPELLQLLGRTDAEMSPPAPTTVPKENEIYALTSLLVVFLGRLQWYFTLVEQSLRSEFLHKQEIVDDWLRTLAWLEGSFFPVYQLFQRAKEVGEPLKKDMAARLPSFVCRLNWSRDILLDATRAPGFRLYGLLRHFREIRAALVVWRRDLASGCEAVQKNAISSRTSVLGETVAPSTKELLHREIAEGTAEVEKGDEIAICMRLRRAFFFLYYTAAVHPEEWTIELHDQVVDLHRRAIEIVPSGLARDSIYSRLEKLNRFDLCEFQRVVNALA